MSAFAPLVGADIDQYTPLGFASQIHFPGRPTGPPRGLESVRLAKALSARLLAHRSVNGTTRTFCNVRCPAAFGDKRTSASDCPTIAIYECTALKKSGLASLDR